MIKELGHIYHNLGQFIIYGWWYMNAQTAHELLVTLNNLPIIVHSFLNSSFLLVVHRYVLQLTCSEIHTYCSLNCL